MHATAGLKSRTVSFDCFVSLGLWTSTGYQMPKYMCELRKMNFNQDPIRHIRMRAKSIQNQKRLTRKWESRRLEEGTQVAVKSLAEAYTDGDRDVKDYMKPFLSRKRWVQNRIHNSEAEYDCTYSVLEGLLSWQRPQSFWRKALPRRIFHTVNRDTLCVKEC